jgi:hypothetical protein
MRPILAATLIALAAPAMAQDAPALLFPVDCTLGETCFLQQFVDRDPGPGARAFDCGPQSYDGHTGTDIRTADLEAMAAGVIVLASADGVVRGLRDGVPDGGTAAMPEGQGCGNGVALTHPGGWETQYCHLMQGSITVTSGQTVTAGTPIGRIGYSGQTEFPHLEFILRRDGQIVDPFDTGALDTCGADPAPLWSSPVENPGGGILSVGFAPAIPEFEAIRAGTADAQDLDDTGPAIVLWGFVHGGRVGDILRLEITDSTGAAFHTQDVTLDRTQAELFRASGRRITGAVPVGDYTGTVTLIRDGATLDTRSVTVPVD